MLRGYATMDVDFYYVAFFKHDRPQHLVAGPFLSIDAAEKAREELGERYVLVSTTQSLDVTYEDKAKQRDHGFNSGDLIAAMFRDGAGS